MSAVSLYYYLQVLKQILRDGRRQSFLDSNLPGPARSRILAILLAAAVSFSAAPRICFSDA